MRRAGRRGGGGERRAMRSCFGCRIVIPERIADANPESRDSGFDAEPVIGPRFARTRWHRPGMTNPFHLSPLFAGRGRREAPGEGLSQRVPVLREPLTPTLSPQERGEGAPAAIG